MLILSSLLGLIAVILSAFVGNVQCFNARVTTTRLTKSVVLPFRWWDSEKNSTVTYAGNAEVFSWFDTQSHQKWACATILGLSLAGGVVFPSPELTVASAMIEAPRLDAGVHKDAFGNLVDSTGARVFSEAYYKFRDEANELAKTKNDCFERSKQAYSEGDKKRAKELSDEGKVASKLMEVSNMRAVEELMKTQRSYEKGVIDLHGLYVKEAAQVTGDFLEKVKSTGRLSEVEIITGRGRHSEGHRAKIKPAIAALLEASNLDFEEKPNNPGDLVVHLK